MRRTSCSACGSDRLEKILDLGTSPIADAYAATIRESLELDRYPLELAVCDKCWLVQLLEVLPQEQLFGTGYSFYTSASPPLSLYHEDYANVALTSYAGELLDRGVVEIGCNDGDLLRHFAAAGCRTLGIDPALGPITMAQGRGLEVMGREFNLHFAQDLWAEHGPVGLVIANHVLAHVADVSDFLAGISVILADDGVALIEVQYLQDLLVNNAFDLVYHEHRNFFSLTSLESALNRHGLYVTQARETDRQGGSIRVEVRKVPAYGAGLRFLRVNESWLQNMGAYEGLQGRVNRIRYRLRALIQEIKGQGDYVAGYGAPAKATTLLNFCGITDLPLVVDTTVAKQGRYIPGTSTQIISPDSPYGEYMFLLLAWNYAKRIIADRGSGRWIVPIPSPMVI